MQTRTGLQLVGSRLIDHCSSAVIWNIPNGTAHPLLCILVYLINNGFDDFAQPLTEWLKSTMDPIADLLLNSFLTQFIELIWVEIY